MACVKHPMLSQFMSISPNSLLVVQNSIIKEQQSKQVTWAAYVPLNPFSNFLLENTFNIVGAIGSMDYVEKVLEKLKEWARKLIETLLGPEVEPEPELIPIPVDDSSRRR